MRLEPISILVGTILLVLPMGLPAPSSMPDSAWLATGLALTMALWWLTEAVPLPATALLPLAVAPILGIEELGEVAQSYSDPLIILFLGGFLIAKGIEKSGLHTRLAWALLRRSGASASRVLGAVMLTTAFLSLWISNTASAMVVAPIAAAIAASQEDARAFGTSVMLGVAFAATIGGMGSLIGTPPNAIFAAHLREAYAIDVGFAQWAMVGLPVAAILLIFAWLSLAWVWPRVRSPGSRISIDPPRSSISAAERRVAAIAATAAIGWMSRPFLAKAFPEIPLSDAGIGITAALSMFLVPAGRSGGERLLDWETAKTLRWDVLILFGGGLALAAILDDSGLAGWIAGGVEQLAELNEMILLFVIAALIVYLGELASNTAMAAIFLPIAGAVAIALGSDPLHFMLPVALAASIGFMLPVATPPNAIVFANPAVGRRDMLIAGAPLDIIGILVAVLGSYMLSPLVFG